MGLVGFNGSGRYANGINKKKIVGVGVGVAT